MICSEFRELLDRYESIDELDRECMDAHCDFCDECRKEMEFFKTITSISASVPCPAPPKTLIAEVNAKLDKMAVVPVGGKTRSWNIKQYATLAACLAVGIAVGVNGGYIKDRLSDKSDNGVISEAVTVTETDVKTPDVKVKTAEAEKAAKVSEGKVKDDKPASSVEKQEAKTDSSKKTENTPAATVKPVATPEAAPVVSEEPEKADATETVAPVPETTPSVNDYAMVGEGRTVAYYSVGTRDSVSKGAIADYILISDEDMGAVFSIMSEMGVSSSDGYYMTNRTDFYLMLDRFDAEGIEYDYQLIHNTGKNIVFKLRYYSIVE